MTNTARLARTAEQDRVLADLRIMAERIHAVGARYGLDPMPAVFTLKSDRQILDDVVYGGLPRHYKHWSYGKQALQMRGDFDSHIFEFALSTKPAQIALGSTNRLLMQIAVMIHAWLGHIEMDANAWFRECQVESIVEMFAQDERFVDWVIGEWGYERYEWFMDAAKALSSHSGWLPSNDDLLADSEHRRLLERSLTELENEYRLPATDSDRQAVQEKVEDTLRLLKCHPIVPTDDLLHYFAQEENTPQLPWEAHHLIDIVRTEERYHKAFMLTRYMHEGWSHWCDSRMLLEPEIDLIGLGVDQVIDAAIAETMHDRSPVRWYNDVYAFGLHLWEYIDQTTSRKIGTETVRFTRLKMEDGHIVDTGIEVERVVDKWDRSFMLEVKRTYNDRRFFETFINDDSMAVLNDKALEWVRRTMAQINRHLERLHWDDAVIFDPPPETLEDMHYAISVWLGQADMSTSVRMWYGFGAPPFPVSKTTLGHMLSIVETVAAWDMDKHAFKRQMLNATNLAYIPNISLVDSGRYSKTGFHTLRHELDPEFGPLAQSDARKTLLRAFRFAGPIQLLTWEIHVDDFGRPFGGPRPHRYFTDNGKTVKETRL